MSLETDVVCQSCSGQHHPATAEVPSRSPQAGSCPAHTPAVVVPSCSLTLRSSPLWHLMAFLSEVLWKAECVCVCGGGEPQPVSVLSLLEKRCSLAFSDGLFWERCAARIALVAPRSHLGWCGFWRRWPPGGGTFSGYLLTLLRRLCWLLAFGCLLTGVSSLNGKQKLNPPPAGPKCWLECGSRWDLKKIFF